MVDLEIAGLEFMGRGDLRTADDESRGKKRGTDVGHGIAPWKEKRAGKARGFF
jgi:hypothetical protein